MPHATRSTKGPSASVMAEPTDEVSQDETSLHEESEPEQEVFIHNPQPNIHQPVYTSMYMSYIEDPKWTGWSMMHYTIHSLNGSLNVKIS